MSYVTVAGSWLTCYAVAAPGLEPLVGGELRALAGRYRIEVGEVEHGGVEFRTDRAGLYAANLQLRIASRVLVRIGSFHAAAFTELERHARRLPWAEFIAPGRQVEFRVTSRKSRLYHQDAIAQRLLEATAANVGNGHGTAAGAPAQEFVVRLFRDQCTVSADASGELLHRRGYRLATARAPLRETLAAAMLEAIGWDGNLPLIDPLCGSGTIPIEAALAARRIPPGLGRTFACLAWPGCDALAWTTVVDVARAAVLPRAPAPILGSDRDAGAVAAAAANAARAGVAEDIEWRRQAISAMRPPSSRGWIVTNPPYGVRIGERLRLRDLYAQLGNVVRRCCAGWEVAFLSSHAELEQQTGLDPAPLFASDNGGIRIRLVRARVHARPDEGRDAG
jgi:putative N6-adenine-specific DNA methylase